MLRWYQAKSTARPVATAAITSAVLFAVGDSLAQQAVEKKGVEKHDYARTLRMAGYGGLIFGPAATKWYQLLQRRVNLSTPTRTTLARVAADQLLFSTTNMALFLSSMAYLEGASPKQRLRDAYFPGLKANWMVWPAVQYVNFTFVPLDARVLVVNFVSIFWNCYLSFLNSGGGNANAIKEYPADA